VTITNRVSLRSVEAGVTPIDDVPDAPTIGAATLTTNSASVTFTAAATGGPVTTYTATSTPGSITGTSATSPVTVAGLTYGTAYTFKVKGTNSTATGPESAATSSVTPVDPTNGYTAGGQTGSRSTAIYSMNFGTETTGYAGALPVANWLMAGFANSGVAGYVAGGNQGNKVSSIVKLVFSNLAVSTLSATLTGVREMPAGFANSGTAGYVAGGIDDQNVSVFCKSNIDKITFSTDARSAVTATMSSSKGYLSGVANSGTAGYIVGGYFTNDFVTETYYSTVDKLVFSGETRSTLAGRLANKTAYSSAFSNNGTAAYIVGGRDETLSTPYISQISKITFSNDGFSTLAGTLTEKTFAPSGMAKTGSAGYITGGQGASYVSRIDKIAFSNDAKSTLSATWPQAFYGMASFSDTGVL